MLAPFLAPETIVFTSAIVLMLLVGVAEVVGVGASAIGVDADIGGGEAGWLGWLGVGRVPLLAVIVAFLACFGVIGLSGQKAAIALTGAMVTPWIAVPGALVAALGLTGVAAGALARVLPGDETTAYPVEGLTGLVGTILVGEARHGFPARASVRDPHGQRHNVLVEPVDPDGILREGQEIILVRQQGHIFRAVANAPSLANEWNIL